MGDLASVEADQVVLLPWAVPLVKDSAWGKPDSSQGQVTTTRSGKLKGILAVVEGTDRAAKDLNRCMVPMKVKVQVVAAWWDITHSKVWLNPIIPMASKTSMEAALVAMATRVRNSSVVPKEEVVVAFLVEEVAWEVAWEVAVKAEAHKLTWVWVTDFSRAASIIDCRAQLAQDQ